MHRALLLASWFLASCTPEPVEPASEPDKPTTPEPTTPEPSDSIPVLGVMQTLEGLTLQVESGGCRKKSDVGFAVVEGKLSIATLTPDSCEAEVVLGENLFFPWAELPEFSKLGLGLGPAPVVQPATTAGATKAPARAKDEAIFGVLVTADGLDVRVWSGGCTDPEHFTAWIEPGETELVHLVRTTPDRCEAYLGDGKLLHFTWTQLGVTKGKARLVNPIDKLPL